MRTRKLSMLFTIVSIIILITLLFLEYKVVSMQNNYAAGKSDCILILGNSLEDGKNPSKWLLERLEAGLSLYNDGFAEKIIVSGGKGPTDKVPVSQSMKEWLLLNGVSDEHILTEEASKNTYENFKFSKAIAKEENIRSVIVVTNDFHIYRSMQIASNFFKNVSGKSVYSEFDFKKLLAYLKEPFSLIKYCITTIAFY